MPILRNVTLHGPAVAKRGAAFTRPLRSIDAKARFAHGYGRRLLLTSIFLAESVTKGGNATAPT